MKLRNILVLLFLLHFSCKKEEKITDPLFLLMSTADTGIDFKNDLVYTEKVNPYTFRNFYNGAGVALGDLNNDGLTDIFLAGNQTSNRLYLNQGEFSFQDVSEEAGILAADKWCTGGVVVDINQDGWSDIYVAAAMKKGPGERNNLLFVNQSFIRRDCKYGAIEFYGHSSTA